MILNYSEKKNIEDLLRKIQVSGSSESASLSAQLLTVVTEISNRPVDNLSDEEKKVLETKVAQLKSSLNLPQEEIEEIALKSVLASRKV